VAALQGICARMHPEEQPPPVVSRPPTPPHPDRTGTQPLRISLALGKREAALGGSSECVRARLLNCRRVFHLERNVPLEMVLLIALADSAAVPVFPLRSMSHLLVDCKGLEGQVVELARDEPLQNGKARLLSGEWDPAAMLEAHPSGTFQLHIFAQVRASLFAVAERCMFAQLHIVALEKGEGLVHLHGRRDVQSVPSSKDSHIVLARLGQSRLVMD
jgi:hypothetical protein